MVVPIRAEINLNFRGVNGRLIICLSQFVRKSRSTDGSADPG